VLLRLADERAAQVLDALEAAEDAFAQIEPQVGRDLVVARAARVQALPGLARELDQAPLDVAMHVLVRLGPLKRAGLDLGADLREPLLDLREIGLADHAGRGEHAGVGEGGLDVVRGEPAVVGDRRGETLDEIGRRLGEPSRPGFLPRFVVGGHAG
jgi:hypothetical protein